MINKTKADYIEWLVKIVETYGRIPKDKIDITLPFLQLGLSSLDVVQIIQDFKKWSGKELAATIFFEYSTIEELAGYLTQDVEEKPKSSVKKKYVSEEPIAIIGMSCRFPGAQDTDEFWNLLIEGRSAISELVEKRINKKLPFKAYAGLLDDIKSFDNEHFNLSSTEVIHMDPQQRLLLELSWEAIEDSGYSANKISGTKTGVYVGISSHDYALEMSKNNDEGHFFDGPGMANSIAANRISYFYNLKGPSFAVDTACSSSLVALHNACLDLRLNNTEMALAGGVNLIISHYLMESFKRAQMLSEDGKCKAFSDDANGYVRSEGGGFLLLKKLSTALRDKDQIHAIIRGSAINQDGRTNTITAPNGLAQYEVINEAINAAGVDAQDISYIETHGTGTPLGDPIEYSALKKVFQENEKIYIGSVKTNIGHAEAAAGIAGAIKTILCLKNAKIPKNLNFNKLNTNINNTHSPLKIPTELTQWEIKQGEKKLAGVSSFGFGGTNAHVIFEEAPALEVALESFSLESAKPYNLFTISSSNTTSLKRTAEKYLNLASKCKDLNLADLCSNIYQQRTTLPARLNIIAKDMIEIENNLKNYLEGKNFEGASAFIPTKVQTKLAVVFNLNQLLYIEISKELYEHFPVFRENFNNCIKKFQNYITDDLFNIWINNLDKNNEVVKVLCFSFEYSFIKLMHSLNIIPHSIVSFSFDNKSTIENVFSEIISNVYPTTTLDKLYESAPTHILEISGLNLLSDNHLIYGKESSSYLKSFLMLVSDLINQNFALDTTELVKNTTFQKIKLPLTQYDRKEFWIKAENTSTSAENAIKKDVLSYINEINQILSQELNIDIKSINPKDELMNLGADSLVMMNCLDIINEKYNVKIGVNDLFQGMNSVEKITAFICDNHVIKNIISEKPIVELNKALISPGSGKGVLGNFNTLHTTKDELIEEEKKKAYLEKLIEQFTRKIKKSKEHTQKFRQYLADNRASAGFRPNLKEMVYPIVFKNAQGAHFEDLDGNKYLDFTMGFGVNLFGHSAKFIQDALKLQLEEGVAVGPQSYLAGKVAEKISKLTKLERVAFVNSGTEAIMTAVRLARAATKREKVVIFEGSYHGHFDGILGRRNTQGDSVPVAPGIARSLINDLIVLEYGSKDALQYIKMHGREIAAVMVEPVQSRFPELQLKEFLKELRIITHDTGSAFIFDEVITGFRIAVGGAQEYFGVQADLATYGKILGGGMPIGAIAGSKFYMDFIDGGDWQFGNSSFPKNELTFFAGTFCKHPFAMTASNEVLSLLDNEGKELLTNLNKKTTELCNTLNKFFNEKKIALELVHFGTLFRFKYQANMDWLFFALNLEGIYIWEGRNMFLSSAHTDEDISEFIEKVKKVVNELAAIGYIPVSNEQIDKLDVKQDQKPMIDSHRRFVDLSVSKIQEDNLSSQIYLAVSFKGKLDENLMLTALEKLIERYDSLQADYDLGKRLITFGVKKKINLGFIDISALPNSANHLKKWLENNSKIILDVNKQPLKVDLIKVSDEEYILSLVVQHIVMDGLSIAFITDDLSKIYNGLKLEKNPILKKTYSFSHYLQNHEGKIASMQDAKSFWQKESKKWQGLSMKETGIRSGSRQKLLLDKDFYKKIRLFGYKYKSSLLVTSLTALHEVLINTFNKQVFTIGVPAAGHISINDPMVGNCVNLAPLTLDFPINDSLFDRINKLRQHQLEVFKFSDYPFKRVLEESTHVINPISIIFNVEPISKLPEFNELKTELLSYPVHASEFPLMFNLMKLEDELHIEMDYQYSLFTNEAAKKFIEDFKNTLLKNE